MGILDTFGRKVTFGLGGVVEATCGAWYGCYYHYSQDCDEYKCTGMYECYRFDCDYDFLCGNYFTCPDMGGGEDFTCVAAYAHTSSCGMYTPSVPCPGT